MTRPYWDGKQDPREYLRDRDSYDRAMAERFPVLRAEEFIRRIEAGGVGPDGLPTHCPKDFLFDADGWRKCKQEALAKQKKQDDDNKLREELLKLSVTELLQRLDVQKYGHGLCDADIAAYEARLGVRFSSGCREYLRDTSRLSSPPVDLLGVSCEDQYDILAMTKDAQTDLPILGRYYVICVPPEEWNSSVGCYLQDDTDCVFAVLCDRQDHLYIEPEYPSFVAFLVDMWFGARASNDGE